MDRISRTKNVNHSEIHGQKLRIGEQGGKLETGNTKLEDGNWKMEVRFRVSVFDFRFSSFQLKVFSYCKIQIR
jgi:hypothetical protein